MFINKLSSIRDKFGVLQIGADEVLARANRLISTRSDISVLIGTYVYIGLWFILFGLVFTKLMKIIFHRTALSE